MRTRVLAALVAASALIAPVALAHEPPTPTVAALGEACDSSPVAAFDDQSLNGRLCRNAREATRLLGDVCRETGATDVPCGHVDGRAINEESMVEYEQSWVHRAQAMQRQLDDDVPLAQALWPHTHNSYNSSSYPITVSGADPNQIYSLTDQLRMDMRILELDVHWHLNEVVLCHGEPGDTEPLTPHIGCSIDRLFIDGLREIRAWLDANPDEVIGIYLENALDNDVAAHEKAVAAIESGLGSLVYKPAGGKCDALPATTVTRRQIRESGARVFLVGNCGPGAWGQWVHERDQRNTWWESGSDFGDDFPAYPACVTDPQPWGTKPWTRVYEDSTWLSQMAGGGGSFTVEETRRAVSCGITMPGFDQLHPHDSRLEALVWSFAADATTSAGCSSFGSDARLHLGDCAAKRRFACLAPDGSWIATSSKGTWTKGASRCAEVGARFVAPWNGLQAQRLAAVATDVWVNHKL